MSRRPSARDWVWIAVLMGTWGAAFAAAIIDGVQSGQSRIGIGAVSAATSGHPVIARVWPGARTTPALQGGDLLLALDGEDLAGWSAVRFQFGAERAARKSERVTLRVERAGEVLESVAEPTPNRVWYLTLIFPAALIGTALLLLVRARSWHLAWRYFLACWPFAMLTTLGDTTGTAPSNAPVLVSTWLMVPAAALTVWNAQDFSLSARPVPVAQRALGVLVFALMSAFVLASEFLPIPGAWIGRLAAAGFGAFAVATLAGLTRGYLRSGMLERRQMRWVLLGFYVALSLNVLANTFGPSPTWSLVLSLGSLGIPAGILISVIGYRWLDVDRVISAAASYTVVGLAVLGGALAFVPQLARASAPAIGIDPSTAQWLLTMALAGIAIPLHRVLRPRIDRRMFAARHARVRGFEQLLEEIGRCASVEELVRLPGERMEALLEPESLAIYAREESLFTPVFVRGRGAPPAFETASLLVRALERRSRPLAADTAELDPFDRAALETLAVSVVVPTRRGDAVVAFTCLGRKRSGDIYTPEEIAYLTAVANRCSEVLVKLSDEVVIQEARDLQRALRRYVPGAVAEELVGGRALESAERDVSVMFVDIRGYSSFAERREVDEIFSTVNRYTERVSELVQQHGGSIVEFNGDGLMAVFGAPRSLERKERAAVEAARELVLTLGAEIAVGVGVATGAAFVGNIRAADRLIWSAIGNTTNLASRLQTLTRELHAAIAIDDATRAASGYVCADFVRHADVAIRGRSERIAVWTLPLSSSLSSR